MTSCPDCPHLDPDYQAKARITPRGVCCVDRMPGHRALMEREAQAKKAGQDAPNRQQRRAAERAARKGR